MTPSRSSFRVQTKMGPAGASAGNASPRRSSTSAPSPISCRAWPTRPPPMMTAGTTPAPAGAAAAPMSPAASGAATASPVKL